MKHFLFLVVFFVSSVFGCGGGYSYLYIKDEYYNFLSPKMVGIQDNNPLYFVSTSYSATQDRIDFALNLQKKSNIQKWQKYFQNTLSYKEVEELFYGKANEYDDANEGFAKRFATIKSKINNRTFDEYASFVIEQLPIANGDTKINPGLLKKLTNKIKTDDKFLAQRYLFLAIRALHYSKKYNEAIALYDRYVSLAQYDQKEDGLVYNWIYALIAGAYQNMGDDINANKMYANLVAKNAKNGVIGYRSFYLQDEASWQKLLGSTQEPDIKALYYFMRSMNWQNAPIKELASIAKIAPKSVWFERLSFMIAQSLQKQRYALMQEMATNSKYANETKISYDLQKNEYLQVLKNIQKPSFFALFIQHYLALLDYQEVDAKQLQAIVKKAKKENIPYVELLHFLQQLNKTNSLQKQKMDALYSQLKNLLPKFDQMTQNSLLRYSALQIATLYPKGSVQELFLNHYARNDTLEYGTLALVSDYTLPLDFIGYMDEKKGFLEAKVFDFYSKNTSKDQKNQVLMMLYMQQNDFDNALKYRAKIKKLDKEYAKSSYNPFNNLISGDNKKQTTQSYTFEKFANTMKELQTSLEQNPNNAMNNYLYGIGLYNKSWFGNFAMSSVSSKSTTYIANAKDNEALLNLSTKYLLTAKALTKDGELRAKIDYAILKNEFAKVMAKATLQEQYFWIPRFGDEEGNKELVKVLQQSPSFISMMKQYKIDYQKTKFGADIIKECVTFKFF